MAADHDIADRDIGRGLLPADIHHHGAATGKTAALLQIFVVFRLIQRHLTLPALARIRLGDGIAQKLGVRVARMHQHLLHAAHLDDVAAERGIVAIYPFMKRFTNLAQLFLGAAFSWGGLMAFTAQTGTFEPSSALRAVSM